MAGNAICTLQILYSWTSTSSERDASARENSRCFASQLFCQSGTISSPSTMLCVYGVLQGHNPARWQEYLLKTAPHLGKVAGAIFAVVDRTSCGEVQFKVGRLLIATLLAPQPSVIL